MYHNLPRYTIFFLEKWNFDLYAKEGRSLAFMLEKDTDESNEPLHEF